MARQSKGANIKNFRSIVDQIQNKFPNFLLGIAVLVIVAVLGSLLFKKDETKISPAERITRFFTGQRGEKGATESARIYTVKEGDHLWMIAEEAYGSGYNAYDIAFANKIENPDIIQPGQKLTLPKVEAKTPTRGDLASGTATEKIVITGKSYTVKEGDSLWKIAEEAYGDATMWSSIAKVNTIANPDLIYAGDTLTLPNK